VKSNELDLHNNEVAKLKKYAVAGSIEDHVEFLYEDYRYDQDMSNHIGYNKANVTHIVN
jgi:hypothetical protein